MHFAAANRRAPWVVEARATARLALPVVFSQLGIMLLGVVDVVMVGHLSERALAAVSLGNTYGWGAMILGMGALMVLDPLVAQAFGAEAHEDVARALHRGLVLAALFSVVIGAVLFWCEKPLTWLSSGSEVVPTAKAFTRNLVPGLPAFFVFTAVQRVLQAMSVVRPLIVAVVVGNVLNVALNYAFIYGRFGAPELGAEGAAVATSICRWGMLGVLLVAASEPLGRIWRKPTRVLLDPRPYLPMLAKGSHIGLQHALEVWGFQAVAILMIRLGTLEMAAHTIALNLASVSFMVPVGIGAAAATRVGNAIGRRDFSGARLSAFVALALGGAVMCVSALLFLFAPRALASLYSREPGVIAMAALLIPLAGIFQVFDGVQAVGFGVLRGAADTRVPAAVNFLGYWIVGLPVGAWLAFSRGAGPTGLWWGLVLGLVIVALLLVARVWLKVGREVERFRS